MKLAEDGSGVNFPNKADITSKLKPEPCPRSSRVASPSPVYCHIG
jgi:hypothetical protein